jgi:hypothetical protein
MNTYKILAEFFTRKFNENGFDKVGQKWLNKMKHKRRNCCASNSYRKKKRHPKRIPLFKIKLNHYVFIFYTPITWRRTNLLLAKVKPLESPA